MTSVGFTRKFSKQPARLPQNLFSWGPMLRQGLLLSLRGDLAPDSGQWIEESFNNRLVYIIHNHTIWNFWNVCFPQPELHVLKVLKLNHLLGWHLVKWSVFSWIYLCPFVFLCVCLYVVHICSVYACMYEWFCVCMLVLCTVCAIRL